MEIHNIQSTDNTQIVKHKWKYTIYKVQSTVQIVQHKWKYTIYKVQSTVQIVQHKWKYTIFKVHIMGEKRSNHNTVLSTHKQKYKKRNTDPIDARNDNKGTEIRYNLM